MEFVKFERRKPETDVMRFRHPAVRLRREAHALHKKSSKNIVWIPSHDTHEADKPEMHLDNVLET